MNNNKKYELLLEICDFYDYKVSEENEKIICRHDEENYFEYKDIDEALCDWYSTLMDSNENHEEYNEINRYTVWSKEEIDFIRCLIRDKALDVVASYAQVLDISIKEINSEHTFDVVITSEKEGKTTVNKMDDYCRIFIDEINTLIDIEHDENKKTSLINMRNIMLDYKYMIKEYGAELVDIGKLAKSWVETREFYEYVVWEDFSDETYMDMGYKIYKEKGILEELIELEESEDGYPSNRAFDLLIDVVDLGVEREGYEFDDHKDGFIKSCIGKVNEVCNSCKKEVSLEDRYDLQKCPNCGEEVLPQDSQSKIVVEKIHDVDEVNQVDEERYDFQMYFDFENSDAINEYFIDWIEGFHFIGCVVDKKDGVFDLDNCEIDMVWNGNNGEKFPFTDEQIRTIKDKVIKEIKDNNMGEVKDSESKSELIKEYGEYGIPFNKAKKLKDFSINYSFSLEEIKRLIVECNEKGYSDLLNSNNVLVVMEFGNSDIELTHYFIDDETDKLDIGFFCCAKYEDGEWESEGFADLEVNLEMFDNKDKFEELMYNAMIQYMKQLNLYWSVENKSHSLKEEKNNENKIKKCEVNNMNALQVKYDIDLKYRGIDFVGVLECHKIECKGIPCVKDDKLELVNALYSQKGCENYIVKFIEINNIIYPISDIRYWYGINTDELFEQINYLINEQETPKEYIKTSYKTYKIENFDDVLEADLEGCIEEFYIEDEVLSNVVQKYMGCDVEFLVSDLNTLLKDINNDMDALESVLGENPKLSYWLNSEVYCYPNCNLDEAYERYLEEEEEIPFKAIDYIDINTFIKNETDLRELELNNCTILYC